MSSDSEPEEDFSALMRTIEDRLRNIDNETYDQPALFIQSILEKSADQYYTLFEITQGMCEDSNELSEIKFSEDKPEEGGRYQVFNLLQTIERDYTRIAELPFRHELYYFLEDVLKDLDIDSDLVVIPGNSAEVFVERSRERFKPVIKSKLAYYSDLDEDHRIIEYQRTELKNPESYPLLIHELFHVFIDEKKEDVDQISKILDEIQGQLSSEQCKYATEILVDLLSVNYTGPIYAHTISKVPEKVGSHTDLVHPKNGEREQYLLQYLNYIERCDASLPVADVDVISKSKETIGEPDADNILRDFNSIQSEVENLLESLEVSVYHNVCNEIKVELGMPEASNEQVRDMLYDLTLYSKPDNMTNNNSGGEEEFDGDSVSQKSNVAVSVRPVFILNLLLEDDRHPSELYETCLITFKKWYVRKQTSRICNKSIDQVPEPENQA